MRFRVAFVLRDLNDRLPAAPDLSVFWTNWLVSHGNGIEHGAFRNIGIMRNSNEVAARLLTGCLQPRPQILRVQAVVRPEGLKYLG